MSKAEIKAKFDEIVNFSGVERYIDTPVKRYSSGMYVRLAFAVAAHLDPEILIVDEVLAVGDAEFQKKCLGKMKDVAGEGRTVLFVSHNMEAIRRLCKNGILLNNGYIERVGMIEDIIPYYLHQGEQRLTTKPPVHLYRTYDISESPIYIEDIYVLNYKNSIPVLSMDTQPEIVIRVNVRKEISGANITTSLYNSELVNVGIAFSWDDNFYLSAEEGLHEIYFRLNENIKLTPGQYSIGVGINQSTHTIAWDGIRHYPIFNIENKDNVKHYTHRPWGINHLVNNSWKLKIVE
jgi:lipopolysaccharide transport system ATP-binding protein